jgi:hypothetical protein
MNRVRTSILAGSSLLLLAACATTPMGPMIPVMPGQSKSQAAFAADEDACQQYAEDRVQGRVQEAQNREVTNGVIGTAIGAGLGAAVGNTKGAIVGGTAGALIGSQAGAGYDQAGVQRRYDMAYASCMTSRGNVVAGGPPRRPHRPGWYYRHGYAPPPPGAGGPPPDEQGPPPDDQGPPPPPDDQGPPPPPPSGS